MTSHNQGEWLRPLFGSCVRDKHLPWLSTIRWPYDATRVRVPEEFSHYLADKGSIAVGGCSLTVCDVQQDLFAVWLIPHTLSLTSLESLKGGDLVNLEFDLLAKYVERISSRGQ